MASISPKLTIITSCYSDERYQDLTELLDSLHGQTYKNMEAIIVIERSRALKEKIKDYIDTKNYQDMRVIFNEGPWGISQARNLAIQQSTGDIIAFIDDDAIAFSDWAEGIVETYKDDSVISVTGPILPLWEDESMSWIPKEFYWIFSCTHWDTAKRSEVRNGYGANLSFHHQAFRDYGLLNTRFGVRGRGRKGWQEPGAEETEFALRIRQRSYKKIIYNPKVKVKHKVYRYRITMKFITRRAYWEGYAKALLQYMYPRGKDKRNPMQTEWALLYRILLRLLPHTLGSLFLKPVISLRRLQLIAVVLSCVAVGYLRFKLILLTNRRKLQGV